MSITIERQGPKTLELHVHGKLEEQDYGLFKPHAEATIEENGELNLIVTIPHELHFTAGTLWEDLKFDAARFDDVGRIALVGDESAHDCLETIAKPFTRAEVRFFDDHSIDAAREWASQQSH